jgi:hypothetical protein
VIIEVIMREKIKVFHSNGELERIVLREVHKEKLLDNIYLSYVNYNKSRCIVSDDPIIGKSIEVE